MTKDDANREVVDPACTLRAQRAKRGPDREAMDAWLALASKLFNDTALFDDAADHYDAPGGEEQDTANRMRAALHHAINLRIRNARYGL